MLSIVIPAYNETENLCLTIPRLRDVVLGAGMPDCEFIVVDDHSSEPMYESVLALDTPNVRCIRLSRRSGSHVALRAGIAVAKGDAVLCISADGQEDPAAVPVMLQQWRNGTQIVWGLRKARDNEGFLQKLFSLAFYKLLASVTESSSQGIDLSRADFYLLDRRVVDSINQLKETNTSLFGLIAWIGFQQGAVEYDRKERRFGKSKWRFRQRMRLAKDWIIAFSGLPLKVMTVVGFLIALTGLLLAVYILVLRLFWHVITIEGWASLIVAVLVLGGFQIAMLGILGEYLWRTLEETRRRRLYFVEKSTDEASGYSIRF